MVILAVCCQYSNLLLQQFRHRIDTGCEEDTDYSGNDRTVDHTRNDIRTDQLAFIAVGSRGRTYRHDIVDADHIADGAAAVLQSHDQYL